MLTKPETKDGELSEETLKEKPWNFEEAEFIWREHPLLIDGAMIHLSNLSTVPHDGEVIHDPRLVSELNEITRLGEAASMRIPNTKDLRNELEEDLSCSEGLDGLVYCLCEYRFWLHEYNIYVRVDPSVVAAAKELLVRLESNAARQEAGRKRKRKEDDTAVETTHFSSTNTKTNPENEKQKRIVHYRKSNKDEQKQQKPGDITAFREDRITHLTTLLERFIDNLTTFTKSLFPVIVQMTAIIHMAEGGRQSSQEITELRKNIANLKSSRRTLEEDLLQGLKYYRLMISWWPDTTSDLDSVLLARIVEAKQLMAMLEGESREKKAERISYSSGEDEMGGCIDSDIDISDSSAEDFASDTDMKEAEDVPPKMNCSCGPICRLAPERPLTPEGELSTEELEMKESYEKLCLKLQPILAFITDCLDTCTSDALSGHVINSRLLVWVKRIKDWAKGKMEEWEVEVLREFVKDEIEGDIERFEHVGVGKGFMRRLIQYYMVVTDEESWIDLDDGIFEACKRLLDVVSEGFMERDDGWIIGEG